MKVKRAHRVLLFQASLGRFVLGSNMHSRQVRQNHKAVNDFGTRSQLRNAWNTGQIKKRQFSFSLLSVLSIFYGRELPWS